MTRLTFVTDISTQGLPSWHGVEEELGGVRHGPVAQLVGEDGFDVFFARLGNQSVEDHDMFALW